MRDSAEGSPEGSPLSLLAVRAQLGNRPALEQLLRRLQRPLGEHIRAMMRDDEAAADALQETLFTIARRLHTLRSTEWVRAWAYRIATREAISSLRRMRRRGEEPMDELARLPAVEMDEEPAFDAELLAALPSRLAALPSASRTVLRLHYLESLTQQEIAEALEIPLGTVKSRIGYGLQLLRATVHR